MKSNKPSIAFILTRSGRVPAGGYKVVYEYANRLARDGYSVTIIYPLFLPRNKPKFRNYLSVVPRYIERKLRGYSCKDWFKLEPGIIEKPVLSLNWKFIPKHDVYIATGVRTSYGVDKFPIDSDRKYYFIQDFENWGNNDDQYVLDSYKLGLRKIVISKWLKEVVNSVGEESCLIRNGFDFNEFKLTNPIEGRPPSILMLYSDATRKGCKYGLSALECLKVRYPHLKATLFGTPPRPNDLPQWIEYYQQPDKLLHNRLYNEASIYLAPSLKEGWGLPVGEAMICGAAIVCTDTLGFQEMVRNGHNGLVVPAKNSKAIVKAVTKLIEDDSLRVEIASQGNRDIQAFSWDKSYLELKNLFVKPT